VTARRWARLAAVLLVVTAGVFVLGVSQENKDNHPESNEVDESEPAGHDDEAGESTEEREAEEADSHDEAADEGREERQILGVDPESPAPVTAAVLASLALAGGLLFTDRRAVAAVATVFALLFAVFDIAEVSHQLDEDSNGLAALAAAIAIGHAAAALAAGLAARRPHTAPEVG
jgi:hypothetical protein